MVRRAAVSRYVVEVLAFGVVYYTTARLGLWLDAMSGIAAPVWPPTGISLAVLLVRGDRLWPGVLLAAFATNLSVGVPPPAALAVGAGNTLEALCGVWLLRRAGFDPALERMRDVAALVGLAALLSTQISAAIGTASGWLSGVVSDDALLATWLNWWVGDALGDIVFAAPLLVWSSPRRAPRAPPRSAEAGALALATLAIGVSAFHTRVGESSVAHALIFPALLWSALRFDQRAVTAVSAGVSALAIWGTAVGRGTFGGLHTNELLSLQIFMGMLGPTGLALCAALSERARAEAELVREHAFATTLVNTAGSLVALLDAGGRITSFNPACERATGWSAADVRGMAFAEVAALPDERAALRAALEGVGAARERGEWEGRLQPREGVPRTVLWSLACLPAGEAAQSTAICVGIDITERRALESKLLLSERLAAMGRLAASVGHEINNPLAYVLLNLQSAQQLTRDARSDPAGLELAKLIEEATEGAQRVRDIVTDLRSLSRATDPAPDSIDVRPVLESAINVASREIQYRARLRREYADVPLVSASPTRLGQVFLNLLVNAAQAIPEGQESAHEILVAVGTDARGWACVAISDTGSGILHDDLERLFDPFFTTKTLGIGLGLSVCRSIVAGLGGEISIESAPGAGTTARVCLPPSAPSQARERAPAQPARGAPQRALRILVIDDEPGLVRSICRILAGHELSVVSDGREGLKRCLAEPFDLVLCDLMMTEFTGMDLAEALERERPELLPRVVFMTGGAFTRHAQAFLRALQTPVLEKPFRAEELLAVVAAQGGPPA